LVLEDDATFHPTGMAALRQGLPMGFDLVFCNHRTAHWCNMVRSDLDPTANVLPLPAIIGQIVRSGLHPKTSPGSDCYMLSPDAARSLVAQADRVRANMGVDWFIVACCLGPDTASGAWQVPATVARMVRNPGPIRSGIAATWAVASGRDLSDPSVILHRVKVPIADFRDAILQSAPSSGLSQTQGQ
jgi:hypothetical protein